MTRIDVPVLIGVIWNYALVKEQLQKQETMLNSLEISDNVDWNIGDYVAHKVWEFWPRNKVTVVKYSYWPSIFSHINRYL